MSKPMSKRSAVLSLVTLLAAAPAAAIDGISVLGGTGEDGHMGQLGLVWDWKAKWLQTGDWSLGGYWEADASYWRGSGRNANSFGGIGITPVFRWQDNSTGGIAPYIEAAVGIHFFSGVVLSDEKKMGSSFEFGDHVGAGFRFGDKNQYEFGYRFQHYSNAGITENNSGVNFHILRLRYGF
jgi:lipid A 3-O-deacylase